LWWDGTAIRVAARLLRKQQGATTNSTASQDAEQPPQENDIDTSSNVGSSPIAAALLIDPTPFLLHHPSVAYNFVYRHPRHANGWQLWYFASRDANVACALSRHFF